MRRTFAIIAGGLLVALVGVGPAGAHAEFQNQTAPADAHQDLVLNVPVEKTGVVNAKIEVSLPEGFEAHSCTAVAGWSCSVGDPDQDEDIVFTRLGDDHDGHRETTPATARPVSVGVMHDEPGAEARPEGETFEFAVHTPAQAGNYPVEVEQEYSNGDETRWSGPEGSVSPAPVLRVQ